MNETTLGAVFLKELEAEAAATRKCLEKIPEALFGWKPHEKSMTLGYLALLVAEIPKWITHMVEKGDIDFATINHLVHHRGQLTVYMRLNNLHVPSIYGPSADEKAF